MKTKLTEAMEERAKATGSEWIDKGEGYFILQGSFHAAVIYIALPEGHSDIGKDYDDLNPEVNGGLTFSAENIFGWDYAHYQNDFDYEGHIKNALEYFKSRE